MLQAAGAAEGSSGQIRRDFEFEVRVFLLFFYLRNSGSGAPQTQQILTTYSSRIEKKAIYSFQRSFWHVNVITITKVSAVTISY
jgi:hypothetical protein